MVGLDQQSVPKQLINEVPSHVVLVNNKVGAVSFLCIICLCFEHLRFHIGGCNAKVLCRQSIHDSLGIFLSAATA